MVKPPLKESIENCDFVQARITYAVNRSKTATHLEFSTPLWLFTI